MAMRFDALPEFAKEFQRLAKKYRSLPDDLEEFKRILSVQPRVNGKHFVILNRNEHLCVIKARFFCRSLKGSSLRIIYAYNEEQINVEFFELYFKGEKENENCERIREYLRRIV